MSSIPELLVTTVGGGWLVHLFHSLEKAFKTAKQKQAEIEKAKLVAGVELAKIEAEDEKGEREHTGAILTEKSRVEALLREQYEARIASLEESYKSLSTAFDLQSQLVEAQGKKIADQTKQIDTLVKRLMEISDGR